MIKYLDTQVVFREFPNETTLAINLTMCPNNCKGCHSSYLKKNIGTVLTENEIDKMISMNEGITCVGFMGGDSDRQEVLRLGKYIKDKFNLKTGWYSGKDDLPMYINFHECFDYIKVGHYDESFGPLDSKTTNQRMYRYDSIYSTFVENLGICWRDITSDFWKKENKN